MLCDRPITLTGRGVVGCGQCIPCRVNRARVWAHRIMIERALHGDAVFVTLTYSDEFLSFTGDGLMTLVPGDLQNFMKRLRTNLARLGRGKVRFFGVGEYGDEDERPHFHLALYNYPLCRFGRTRKNRVLGCCDHCNLILNTWGKGHIMLGTLEDASASYIAGYVLKKMTSPDDFRLHGRHPEFARMSNRPGIGADMMHEVASELMRFNLENTQADLPVSLRHGKRVLPLGRYLTKKLAQYVGKEEQHAEKGKAFMAEEMRRLQSLSISLNTGIKGAYEEENRQRLLNFHARHKIRKK